MSRDTGPEDRGDLPNGLEERFCELLERRDEDDPLMEDKELYVRGWLNPRGLTWKILRVLGRDLREFSHEATRRLDLKVVFAMKLAARDRAEYGGAGVGAVGAMRVELVEAWHGEASRYLEGGRGKRPFTLRLVCDLCEGHIPEIGGGHVMVLSDPPRRIYFTHQYECYESLAREVLVGRLGPDDAPSREELQGLRAPSYDGMRTTPWGHNVALKTFLGKVEFAERRFVEHP